MHPNITRDLDANAQKYAEVQYERTIKQGQLPQRDRASAFVTPKLLARAEGVADPLKIFLTSSLITQHLIDCSFSCCVHTCWRSQKFGGR